MFCWIVRLTVFYWWFSWMIGDCFGWLFCWRASVDFCWLFVGECVCKVFGACFCWRLLMAVSCWLLVECVVDGSVLKALCCHRSVECCRWRLCASCLWYNSLRGLYLVDGLCLRLCWRPSWRFPKVLLMRCCWVCYWALPTHVCCWNVLFVLLMIACWQFC